MWFVDMRILRKKYLLITVGFVIVTLPYVVILVYPHTVTANGFRRNVSSVKRFPWNGSFVSALTALADADHCILLAMVDEAFTDMAINFYEASLQAHHINNFLFVGVGRKACKVLSNLSIPCFYYADDPSANQVTSWGELDFERKMNIRTDMILEALTANFTVIHSDTDVAFLSNPLNALKVYNLTCATVQWRRHDLGAKTDRKLRENDLKVTDKINQSIKRNLCSASYK